MGSWSYRTRELWQLHKREIKKYGVCAWFLIAGLSSGTYILAWAGLIGAVVMYCFDRWGKPWAERGRVLMEGNKTDKEDS